MMMTEEMVTALKEEAVTIPLTEEEAMIVDVPLVHIVGIGVVLIMDMDLFRIPGLHQPGEVPSTVRCKALRMTDTTG